MSDHSRSPRGAAVPSEADLRAALAAAEAALAAAEAALAAERARLATVRGWAAESRISYLGALRSTYHDCTELAVLARRACASGDLIDYWYTAPAPAEPEPEAEPDPQ
jgi:hypothetical protein